MVAGVLAAIFYRLALQPAILTPAQLLLSLVPFMLVGGFLGTHPRFAAIGIDFNMCFMPASQALIALAQAEPEGGTRRGILRLAESLGQASELLSY